MSDDKAKRGAPDRNLINLSEDHEIRYWTKELGLSEAELRKAVKEHGNSVSKVRAALKG